LDFLGKIKIFQNIKQKREFLQKREFNSHD